MAGSIDQLIVNAPYVEPERHWRYDRESRTFSLEAGRRPAGYVVATQGSKSFDDPGLFVELPLVNRSRPRVKAWREAGYPGVTTRAFAGSTQPSSRGGAAQLELRVRRLQPLEDPRSPPASWRGGP